jgi:hypothetical protein
MCKGDDIMLKIEELKEWCWVNLRFDNCPEIVEDTYVEDIINGYNGDCYTNDGKVMKYWEVRDMFTEYDEEEE